MDIGVKIQIVSKQLDNGWELAEVYGWEQFAQAMRTADDFGQLPEELAEAWMMFGLRDVATVEVNL